MTREPVDDPAFDDGTPDSDDLPSTDVEVEVHVHFGMTGSFPLRLADLFFADDGLYVAEYSYITPMFGLATKKHRRDARGMARIYEVHGLDEVLLQADAVFWHSYDALDRVELHDGGWLGRPKIAVYPVSGPSRAYRFHDDVLFEELVADLEACGRRRGFDVDHHRGLGFAPRESVARFFGRA